MAVQKCDIYYIKKKKKAQFQVRIHYQLAIYGYSSIFHACNTLN